MLSSKSFNRLLPKSSTSLQTSFNAISANFNMMGLFSTQVMKDTKSSIFVANLPFHIGDEEFTALVAQQIGDMP
jgi:hypothetical protein